VEVLGRVGRGLVSNFVTNDHSVSNEESRTECASSAAPHILTVQARAVLHWNFYHIRLLVNLKFIFLILNESTIE
jgi:hypothetical protein